MAVLELILRIGCALAGMALVLLLPAGSLASPHEIAGWAIPDFAAPLALYLLAGATGYAIGVRLSAMLPLLTSSRPVGTRADAAAAVPRLRRHLTDASPSQDARPAFAHHPAPPAPQPLPFEKLDSDAPDADDEEPPAWQVDGEPQDERDWSVADDDFQPVVNPDAVPIAVEPRSDAQFTRLDPAKVPISQSRPACDVAPVRDAGARPAERHTNVAAALAAVDWSTGWDNDEAEDAADGDEEDDDGMGYGSLLGLGLGAKCAPKTCAPMTGAVRLSAETGLVSQHGGGLSTAPVPEGRGPGDFRLRNALIDLLAIDSRDRSQP